MISSPHLWLAKWYTRVVAVAFILIVISLVNDYLQFGIRGETWHKVFHIVLGIVVALYAWHNQRWWKPFCLTNGTFFTMLALIGVLYPNLGGLDAFNAQDTLLHGMVGILGLGIGLYACKKR